MQDRLLLKETSAKEPSGTVSILQKLKIKVPLKFPTKSKKFPTKVPHEEQKVPHEIST